MSEKIEWTHTETREYRNRLRVVRDWDDGKLGCQDERYATVEDLRRACEAAGVTMLSEEVARAKHAEDMARVHAKHAEDLHKLAVEMAKIIDQRDEARASTSAWEKYSDRIRTALGTLGAQSETIEDAARRVLAERDAARASAALVTMVGDIGVRNSADATKLEGIIAERDTLRAELDAIRAAGGEEPTDTVLSRLDNVAQDAALKAIVAPLGARLLEARLAGHRALYNLGRTAAQGEVAMMREAARGRDATIETLRTQQEEQAEEVATLRDRVDGLEIDLNSAVQNSKASEVEANNLRSANRTLWARVAELEAAPVGLPVATDEELWEGCDIRVAEDVAGWLVAARESADSDG